MNIRNHINKILFLIFCLMGTTQATMVLYQDDAYAKQAPECLVALVEKVAQTVEFASNYEVVIPTKAGTEINPWNKFIGHGINSITKNPFIIVNPEWIASLSEDQQSFLVGRALILLKQGVIPSSFKILWYIFAIISVLVGLLLFWIMGKTALKNQKVWVRIILAMLLVICCEFIFLDPIHDRMKVYLGKLHDQNVHELVIQKLGSKDAAIKALRYFDDSIKDELKKGDNFFAPYENLFESHAQKLQKS